MRRLKTALFLLLTTAAAGCAGTDVAGIAPTAGTTVSGAPPVQGGAGDSAATPTTNSAAIAAARVQFAPVIGAPAEAIGPLSTRLSARAGQHGLTITREAENATHIVKGYFSAIAENGQTTVIYVWDVLDPAGNRLHRFQGQERSGGGRDAGWDSVAGATMEVIADRTIDELTAWLSSRSA